MPSYLLDITLVERKPGALRNGAPFDGMPEALLSLRVSLIRRPGGDRLMADILACIPKYSLESVLVAAELILESGNTSSLSDLSASDGVFDGWIS